MATMNVQSNTPIALAERSDIHKSCKALEAIVNSFNDYCQASEALVHAQRRLAKALKDAAGMKVTGEHAVTSAAMNVVSGLLEGLADVDMRFVKVADRECEGASNELKKWFKKLAKEEKAHDERVAAANAKIKQAGQAYEKKAKRKDRDAVEEHARYVNLLNSIGPEMSQENHSHALFVTQRHNSTVSTVAATIARTTEADWLRVCEYIRRAAPAVGPIGESRAYLEGGWMGQIPSSRNLEVPDDGEKPDSGTVTKSTSASSENEPRTQASSQASSSLMPSQTGVATPVSNGSCSAPGSANGSNGASAPNGTGETHPPTAFARPVRPFASTENANSVRSIETLSSFPTPPSHFPLPTLNQTKTASNGINGTVTLSSSTTLHDVRAGTSTPVRLTESPRPLQESLPSNEPFPPAQSDNAGQYPQRPRTITATPSVPARQDEGMRERDQDSDTIKGMTASPPAGKTNVRETPPPQEIITRKLEQAAVTSHRGGTTSEHFERTDSVTSSSSVVTSLRNKWDNNVSPTSSPTRERDIPRLPNKVSDLASRYTTADKPSSPTSPRVAEQYHGLQQAPGSSAANRHRDPNSPRPERRIPTSNVIGDLSSSSSTSLPYAQERGTQPQSRRRSPIAVEQPASDDMDIARRRQRLFELEELELREHEHTLRAREREIELRALELERDRARLINARTATTSMTGNQANSTSDRRPLTHYSYSATNLSPGQGNREPHPRLDMFSQHQEPLTTPGPASTEVHSSDHAPFCGCYTCSVLQYRSPAPAPQPHDMRPPEPPPSHLRPEKPRGGWMRRLSMPVVSAAFSNSSAGSGSVASVDSRKGVRNVVNMTVPTEEGLIVRRSFERDASGGISNIAARPRKLSFGRRS